MEPLSIASDSPSDIVLVEDNPNDAEMALRALRRIEGLLGVRWFKDGAEALDYFFPTISEREPAQPMPPRLVLLDLKLPRVDGHEVLERMKVDPRTKSIPVVVLTSSREESDIVPAAV